jgi:hypothetical protein
MLKLTWPEDAKTIQVFIEGLWVILQERLRELTTILRK